MKNVAKDPNIVIYGRNAVKEALAGSERVLELYYREGLEKELEDILTSAGERAVRIARMSEQELEKRTQTRDHQGVSLLLPPFAYSTVEAMLDDAREKEEKPFLILLDSIQDPHNLGAIIRTAHQCGAHGVILPKNRAAAITGTVYKTSAGAVNYMKIAKVTNLSRTIEELKKENVWFVGADMGGSEMYDVDFTSSVGIVIGSEGKGLSDLVRKSMDHIASIPMKGKIDSLNASVAAGVLMYEAVRQRK